MLALPRFGCVNVHGSLLPRHRGAAPVAAAILAGDAQTGVSIMLMDVGVDTGPVLATAGLPIRAEDTTGSLTGKLADLGADLLARTLPGWLNGAFVPWPQPAVGATSAPRDREGRGGDPVGRAGQPDRAPCARGTARGRRPTPPGRDNG